MKKNVLLTLIICIIYTFQIYAQSSNFKAQGYYYKAKELFEARSYISSLDYIQKSKDALGGTNKKLQYLHIVILVKQKDWVEADNQMKKFFAIQEGEIQAIYFSKGVDELTDDETYELTKILVDIEENAAYVNSPEGKEEELIKNIHDLLVPNLNYSYSKTCMRPSGSSDKIKYNYKIINTLAKKIEIKVTIENYEYMYGSNNYGKETNTKYTTFHFADIESVSLIDSKSDDCCDLRVDYFHMWKEWNCHSSSPKALFITFKSPSAVKSKFFYDHYDNRDGKTRGGG